VICRGGGLNFKLLRNFFVDISKLPTLQSVQLFYCCSRSDEEEEQSGASKNMHITSFFKQAGSNKRQKTKHTFFTVRNLDVSDSL
jgi:hypothetical protein